jgi:hypothetical protein
MRVLFLSLPADDFLILSAMWILFLSLRRNPAAMFAHKNIKQKRKQIIWFDHALTVTTIMQKILQTFELWKNISESVSDAENYWSNLQPKNLSADDKYKIVVVPMTHVDPGSKILFVQRISAPLLGRGIFI